jgi:FemAB family protein
MVDELNRASPSKKFTIKTRKKSGLDWNYVLGNSSYSPVDYSQWNIDYQLEYYKSVKNLKDYSIVGYLNNYPIFIFVLIKDMDEQKSFNLFINNYSVVQPLIDSNLSQKRRKEIIEFLMKLLNEFELNPLFFESNLFPLMYDPNWFKELNDRFKIVTAMLESKSYLNLGDSIDNILKSFNKGTKYDIKKSLSLFNVEVLDSIEIQTFNDFKALHYKAAGRLTRTEETWRLQFNAINEDNAFLVISKNNDNKLIGAALFGITEDEMEYSVAAYERSLFDFPVSHGILFKAIEFGKSKNLKYLKLGTRLFESNYPSIKEKNISNFKKHFSSEFHITLSLMVEDVLK